MNGLPLPMKATSGSLPVGDDWIHEIKWDGMRAVVGVGPGGVRISSANGKDATVSFPELAGLAAAIGVPAVLDGELVALDGSGRPDFGLLQSRMHVGAARVAAERAGVTPVVYVVFDLLALDGNDLTGRPWSDRRRLLEQLVEAGPHWQLCPVHDDGAALLDAARSQRLEGIVSKRTGSTYRPGTRTREWVKVKVRNRQEFVVGGWAPGERSRAGTIGGLLLGYHEPAGSPTLRYAGRAGSGLSAALLDVLRPRLRAADTCPFDPAPPPAQALGATWVSPDVVVEVAFAEWTAEGRLRHPSIVAVRDDRDAESVTAAP